MSTKQTDDDIARLCNDVARLDEQVASLRSDLRLTIATMGQLAEAVLDLRDEARRRAS
jgi:hypothetical protein